MVSRAGLESCKLAQFKGKVAIVTGGSGGIGSAACQPFSAEGASVVVHYNGHEDVTQQVVQQVTAAQGRAIVI